MTHFDENTLELFVLGAKEVERQRTAIEAHLKKCEGCRMLVRSMSEFYSDAESHFTAQDLSQPRALIHRKNALTPLHEPYYSTLKYPVVLPKTFIQHVYSFAKQNPVKTAAGSFASLAVLGLLLTFVFRTTLKDANPAYSILNVPHTALEVYNREDELLWQLPSAFIPGAHESENTNKICYTAVADLYGDGRNEVITVIPLPNDDSRGKSLRVYDGKKNILGINQLQDSTLNFLSNHYETSFSYDGIAVADFAGDGRREVFASIACTHSPWSLARFDERLHIIGRFWHFGDQEIYEADLNNDGKKELILSGVNQVDELRSGQFGDVIVLDPEKIEGEAESIASRGYGLQASNAEIYYLRFPESDMFKALGTKQNGPVLVSSTNERQLKFSVRSSLSDGPFFEYNFTKDMRVQEVKFGSPDVWIHAKLKKEGKVSSTFDQKYLEDLKNGVRYWDGKAWTKEVTKVRHEIAGKPQQ